MPTFSILWDSEDEAGFFVAIKDHLLAEKMHVFLAAAAEHATLGRGVKNDVLRVAPSGFLRVAHG